MRPPATGSLLPARAASWMIIAQILFAAMATSARIGGRRLPWQEVCASRFLVGALTVLLVARARGRTLGLANRRASWARSVLGTVSAAGTFYLYATPHLPIGDAATLLSTTPIFVALLGVPLLGESVRRSVVAALVCGFAGIALVAQPTFSTASHLVVIGTLTAITAALAFIWLRRIGSSESSEAVVFHFACVGSAAMLLLSVPVWRTPDARDAAALFATGFFGGIAQIAMTRAFALDAAARVSVLGYSGVIFTRVLAFVLFGEVPDAAQTLGSLLIVGAGAILLGRRVPT